MRKLLYLVILALAIFIQLPSISSELPYFSNEDEAHHFNRTVNMLKTGDLNPHYFLKPSLHFYLRLPVTALSFFKSVSNGQLRSIQEVQTEDRFGLAGYSFSASHPALVKANRLFSLALLIGGLIAIIAICSQLGLGLFATVVATLLTAISPALYGRASVIGVDSLVFFLTLLSTFFAIKTIKDKSISSLIATALVAGLATSSKYNACPVMLLPVVALFLSGISINARNLASAALVPLAAFLIGSPFILLEIPLFLDHFAYEIWHYGVAGHEGHLQVPGLPHFIFILQWIRSEGLGTTAFIAALLGLILSQRVIGTRTLITLATFPGIYLALMSMQKTAFERNYLILIPFFAILCGLCAKILSDFNLNNRLKRLLLLTFTIGAIHAPALSVLEKNFLDQARAIDKDSRVYAREWLEKNQTSGTTLLDGELQLAPLFNYPHGQRTFSVPGLLRTDLSQKSALEWFLSGADRLVTGAYYPIPKSISEHLVLKSRFIGVRAKQRIVKNPQIFVYDFEPDFWKSTAFTAYLKNQTLPEIRINDRAGDRTSCEDKSQSENQCWTNFRATKIIMTGQANNTPLSIMSPWAHQEVAWASVEDGQIIASSKLAEPGEWQDLPLPSSNQKEFYLLVKTTKTPTQVDIKAKDSRNLGVALR